MENPIEYISKPAPAAETAICVCLGIMPAALAVWLVCESIRRLLQLQLRLEARRNRQVQLQLRLEDSRNHQEAIALDNWQRAFEKEKADHTKDLAELRNRLYDSNDKMASLKKRIEEKDKLLSMVPLSVLEEVKARAEQ